MNSPRILWLHRIMKNDKIELRPQDALSCHKDDESVPARSAPKMVLLGYGPQKNIGPVQKPCFFFQKRHGKKVDDGFLFHISEVPQILQIRFLEGVK